jgi:uncharacterized membrane protein YcaP (DUF421 family)
MNPVIRGVVIYLFVLLIFRILGKRSLAETTTFDFVLLLIISETTTDALIGEDYSLTASMIMISTLVGADLLFSLLKERSKGLDRFIDGAPLVIVDHGKLLQERMKKSRVDEEDVLEAARLIHGLENLKQIKYAVLEKDGSISIIPMSEAAA